MKIIENEASVVVQDHVDKLRPGKRLVKASEEAFRILSNLKQPRGIQQLMSRSADESRTVYTWSHQHTRYGIDQVNALNRAGLLEES